MEGCTIGVVVRRRQAYRQVVRALGASGSHVLNLGAQESPGGPEGGIDLLVVDCEEMDAGDLASELHKWRSPPSPTPTVVLCSLEEMTMLCGIFKKFQVTNFVAKSGSSKTAHPVVDERELQVTCDKLLRKDIFGLEKYLHPWGVVIHEDTAASMADRQGILERFERFLSDLDCPPRSIPSMITVLDELLSNAILHAPCREDGTPKYHHTTPRSDIKLDQDEQVRVRYACDGQRVLLSVVDRLGSFKKQQVLFHVSRALAREPTMLGDWLAKTGLGFKLAISNLHQLIFNIQESVSTEVIAGWNIRISSNCEFVSMGKSLNMFWAR